MQTQEVCTNNRMLQTFKLTIAYDGTAYCGWQRQIDPVPTVQRTVEKAAGEIVSHPVIVCGASRTDTGVHAMGQVARMEVNTTLEPERLRRAINSGLPQDINIVSGLESVPSTFDVRHAVNKRYRYLIWSDRERSIFYRHYVYQYWHEVQLELHAGGLQNPLKARTILSPSVARRIKVVTTVRTIFSKCDI